MTTIMEQANKIEAATATYHPVKLTFGELRQCVGIERVWQTLAELKPVKGWLQLPSANDYFFSNEAFEQLHGKNSAQPLLNGELLLEDGASAKVQFIGSDHWQIVTLSCTSHSAQEATTLAQDIELAGHHGVTLLKYRRYFDINVDTGPKQIDYRLIDIKGGENV